MTNSRASFRNGGTPTVLLLHGAFADASSWTGVITDLQAAGIPVIAPANPLRGLTADISYVAGVVRQIDGPVLLVGHSYGGAIITGVGAQVDNAVGLVYVTAFALDEEESCVEVAARFPETLLGLSVRPAAFETGNAAAGVELHLKADRFSAVFAAGLPGAETSVMAVAQRPIVAGALEERLSAAAAAAAAWRTLPSWYVVATADQAIHPDAQRFMAQRADAQTIEVDGSHAVALSQPAAVAGHIRAAATAPPAVGASR